MVWFLWPFLVHDHRFPLGPDAPVYLWWTRLAGEEGLSAVGHRAGAPALGVVLHGTLTRSVVEATAAIEVALGAAVGLASAALLRGRTATVAWVLAGLLAGTFAVHLAAGYLANLVQASAFLAAAVALAEGSRRGAWLAAALLGAGGLAHPLFFAVGALILLVAAATAWRTDRAESVRVGSATVLGAGVVGAGLLALLIGPAPPEVDTSRDAFLRRAGLTNELRSAYLDRFLHRWTRYVQWASVPLAIVGVSASRGFVDRFLRAWGIVLVAGVVVALVTGSIPADRFVTFGSVVPILAALGIVRLFGRLSPRRTVAFVATGSLTIAMLAGAFIAWNRQEPFLSVDEVRAATIANALSTEFPAGWPLVFLVNEADPSVTFLATRAGNVIRAAVPPDRIRDVVVVVPPLFGDPPGGPERGALERLTERDRIAAEDESGMPGTTFLLRAFDDVDRVVAVTIGRNVGERSTMLPPEEPLGPATPAAIARSSLMAFALLAIGGFGWARVATADVLRAAAAAPAIGCGVLVLGSIALERVGLHIETSGGAWVASVVSGGGGYLAWWFLERRPGARPSNEVEQ